MARPSKPTSVLLAEGKSHRTKAEIEARQKGEEALLSGKVLKVRQEVKENIVAYKEFKRLQEILKELGKNDAIYEAVINRYCLIYAECVAYERQKNALFRDLDELTEDKEQLIDSEEISLSGYYKLKNSMQKNILDLDKNLQVKRKMLMEIEKENIMTIAAAIRCVPKKDDVKESNPIFELLGG